MRTVLDIQKCGSDVYISDLAQAIVFGGIHGLADFLLWPPSPEFSTFCSKVGNKFEVPVGLNKFGCFGSKQSNGVFGLFFPINKTFTGLGVNEHIIKDVGFWVADEIPAECLHGII